jgi:hypothetical protein
LLEWQRVMIFPLNKDIVGLDQPKAKSKFAPGDFGYKAVAAIWLVALLSCMVAMSRYASNPGPTGQPPDRWPVDSLIALDAQRPTLLMFAHPKCPCTRASIRELEQLMSDCRGLVDAQVWFIQPAGTHPGFVDTDLWRSAAAIPGVTVHADKDGTEAQRFQSWTSGETVLYVPSGELWFHGGITIARGHEGDNPGLDEIENLLKAPGADAPRPALASTPVFGCELFGSCTRQDNLPDTNQCPGVNVNQNSIHTHRRDANWKL